MAKLNDSTLREGRQLVISSDLEGLMEWIRLHAPTVDPNVYEPVFRLVFAAQDTARGLKLFNTAFGTYDADAVKTAQVAGAVWGIFKLLLSLAMIVGSIGGLVYLFRTLF